MDKEKLFEAIQILRLENGDNQKYEAKAAAFGMPENLKDTISAFSNTPGGGTLLLGVDENKGFALVGVYDSKKCQQTLANYAKNEFNVPIDMKSALIPIESRNVVWVDIKESDKTVKPIKIKGSGKAYIRLYDSDFELSEQEQQLFVAGRGPSNFDEEILTESGISDLDEDLTRAYINNRRQHSKAISAMSDDDVLLRTGVINRKGELTRAGAAALGVYPQQFMANYSIKVSVRKRRRGNEQVRAVNVNSIDGPIPTMLDETMKWVEQNTDELMVELSNGHVRTVREYPLAAVRELVSNALIHRDMNQMSMYQSISLTIDDEKIVISNPGGLYGLTVEDLGYTGSRTRNARLAEICQYVRTEEGENILEKLGSGIPKVREELASLNMRPPLFYDGGIYFTAILKSGGYAAASKGVRVDSERNSIGEILSALRDGALSMKELQNVTKLTSSQVRYTLSKLIRGEKVRKTGKGSSPATKYTLY